jgi:hypothetical protein
MLFFRSEDKVREWCGAHGHPLRPIVPMTQLWGLAQAWYANRLDPEARRPQPDEMVRIFAGLGLTGPFWDPASDVFG